MWGRTVVRPLAFFHPITARQNENAPPEGEALRCVWSGGRNGYGTRFAPVACRFESDPDLKGRFPLIDGGGAAPTFVEATTSDSVQLRFFYGPIASSASVCAICHRAVA
jgi:hypothetical protein